MTTLTRSLTALAALVIFASPAFAGPPLVCHPFMTDGGKLLAWGTGPGWNTPDPAYDIKRLVSDTTAILTPDTPILTRMENLRRASIYAMRDPVVARDLLKAVMNRALGSGHDDLSWFDAGYLVETYKQASPIRELHASHDGPAWTEVNETLRIDGYNWVKKAMAMTGASAEMEFAASLMTRGTVASAHRARAVAAAPKGSVLARNLAALDIF